MDEIWLIFSLFKVQIYPQQADFEVLSWFIHGFPLACGQRRDELRKKVGKNKNKETNKKTKICEIYLKCLQPRAMSSFFSFSCDFLECSLQSFDYTNMKVGWSEEIILPQRSGPAIRSSLNRSYLEKRHTQVVLSPCSRTVGSLGGRRRRGAGCRGSEAAGRSGSVPSPAWCAAGRERRPFWHGWCSSSSSTHRCWQTPSQSRAGSSSRGGTQSMTRRKCTCAWPGAGHADLGAASPWNTAAWHRRYRLASCTRSGETPGAPVGPPLKSCLLLAAPSWPCRCSCEACWKGRWAPGTGMHWRGGSVERLSPWDQVAKKKKKKTNLVQDKSNKYEKGRKEKRDWQII